MTLTSSLSASKVKPRFLNWSSFPLGGSDEPTAPEKVKAPPDVKQGYPVTRVFSDSSKLDKAKSFMEPRRSTVILTRVDGSESPKLLQSRLKPNFVALPNHVEVSSLARQSDLSTLRIAMCNSSLGYATQRVPSNDDSVSTIPSRSISMMSSGSPHWSVGGSHLYREPSISSSSFSLATGSRPQGILVNPVKSKLQPSLKSLASFESSISAQTQGRDNEDSEKFTITRKTSTGEEPSMLKHHYAGRGSLVALSSSGNNNILNKMSVEPHTSTGTPASTNTPLKKGAAQPQYNTKTTIVTTKLGQSINHNQSPSTNNQQKHWQSAHRYQMGSNSSTMATKNSFDQLAKNNSFSTQNSLQLSVGSPEYTTFLTHLENYGGIATKYISLINGHLSTSNKKSDESSKIPEQNINEMPVAGEIQELNVSKEIPRTKNSENLDQKLESIVQKDIKSELVGPTEKTLASANFAQHGSESSHLLKKFIKECNENEVHDLLHLLKFIKEVTTSIDKYRLFFALRELVERLNKNVQPVAAEEQNQSQEATENNKIMNSKDHVISGSPDKLIVVEESKEQAAVLPPMTLNDIAQYNQKSIKKTLDTEEVSEQEYLYSLQIETITDKGPVTRCADVIRVHKSPSVLLMTELLTQGECDKIQKAYEMSTSETPDADTETENTLPFLRKCLRRRLAAILKINKNEVESIEVLKRTSEDAIFKMSIPYNHAHVFVFLNGVNKGGNLEFFSLNFNIIPRFGTAVLWMNCVKNLGSFEAKLTPPNTTLYVLSCKLKKCIDLDNMNIPSSVEEKNKIEIKTEKTKFLKSKKNNCPKAKLPPVEEEEEIEVE